MGGYDFRKSWVLLAPVALAALNQQMQAVTDSRAQFALGVLALALNHFVNPGKKDGS